ncbi:MAG TPA: hypothetical protein VN836_01270 [Verrucomicrobiae bacterium]|nr:hypothetical protein [Verrucomicrobiae bacterium]
MKILLGFLAMLCVLLAVVAFLLPLPPPPKPDATAEQATQDAINHLAWPPDMLEPTNDVTIHRATLEVLTRQAESPESTWRCAWFFSKTTSVFAFVSGVSLLFLSRKIGK